MYTIKRSGKFKKEFKKIQRAGNFDTKTFLFIIDALQEGEQLPENYKNHKLQGKFNGCSECHIKSDILLIYKPYKDERELHLLRIGSHSELFG